MRNGLLLSLDLSISGIKAGLFDIDGRCVALVNREYLQIAEGQSLVEFDPEAYWQAVAAAIRQTLQKAQQLSPPILPESILSLSISSHGETVVFLDSHGKPTRPGILTLDARAEAQAEAITCQLGREEIYSATGQPDVLPIWTAAKIAWLRENEPEVYRKTALYLLPQGYIIYRLCSQAVDDPSVMTTSLLFDICKANWYDEVLAFAGIHAGQLPQVRMPGTVAGMVSPAAAFDTGLCQSTKIVVGALDQICAAVGAGNIQPGFLTESTGSVLALVATTDKLVYGGLPVYPHAVPGMFCLLPWHQTGGLVLKWFKDRFGEIMEGDEYAALVNLAAQVPAGAEGLVMLPHLEGITFPNPKPGARGVFYGIGLKHGRGHFVRAIMESMGFLIRQDVEFLRAAGVDIQDVVSMGGGAKSDLWMQIKADVCGIPFRTLETNESALLGAAMLAAVGAGVYADLSTAVQKMSRPGRRFLPNRENQAVYDRGYVLYETLQERLSDIS